MDLVTLRTFDNRIDAHLARTKLESEGIKGVLFDENIVSLNPIYNLAAGGIKLKVRQEDHERASQLLNGLDRVPVTDEQGQARRCPACGSQEIYSGFKTMRGVPGVLAFVLSLLLMVFPFFFESLYRCKKCGYEFKV